MRLPYPHPITRLDTEKSKTEGVEGDFEVFESWVKPGPCSEWGAIGSRQLYQVTLLYTEHVMPARR